MSAAPAMQTTVTVAASTVTAAGALENPAICRFFLRGVCRFGPRCRYSHDRADGAVVNNSNGGDADNSHCCAANNVQPSSDNRVTGAQPQQQQPQASTSSIVHRNWVDAPVFVPTGLKLGSIATASGDAATNEIVGDMDETPSASNKTWADVVGTGGARAGRITTITAAASSIEMVCPYESPCPYDGYCAYALHLELCKMCDQYCLHPNDQAQRRKHNQDCLQQHEQAMELSFAIARSKDKTCGICFDTIMEKSGREKRFGILPNCSHIFCLECIRKWRQAKQFEHKITRSCPECRVSSDFVCPSAFWVETKEEKDKLLSDYRTALGIKDCKYFKKGEGKCPFGNKCFYKHALPNGDLVDVGCPKRARKLHRGTSEIIDLLDIYLWEFVDQRDYHFLELLSSSSDESDDSDWPED